jgi:hypothetical protein
VLKKDRQHNCYTVAYLKNNDTNILPYSFKKQLSSAQFKLIGILLPLIQSEKQVRLERLSRVFPYPITTESRSRKLQRFLDLPNSTISLIWFPLITYWLLTYCRVGTRLSIAIDRSQWGRINLFMVSLIWERRAIRLYWSLLPKLETVTSSHSPTNLQQVLPLFSEYKVIVLGQYGLLKTETSDKLGMMYKKVNQV